MIELTDEAGLSIYVNPNNITYFKTNADRKYSFVSLVCGATITVLELPTHIREKIGYAK